VNYSEFMMNPADARAVAAAAAHGVIMPSAAQYSTIQDNKKYLKQTNSYDVQSFTSFNNTLPIYPRTSAFYDFSA
jgi:hypothetical protein